MFLEIKPIHTGIGASLTKPRSVHFICSFYPIRSSYPFLCNKRRDPWPNLNLLRQRYTKHSFWSIFWETTQHPGAWRWWICKPKTFTNSWHLLFNFTWKYWPFFSSRALHRRNNWPPDNGRHFIEPDFCVVWISQHWVIIDIYEHHILYYGPIVLFQVRIDNIGIEFLEFPGANGKITNKSFTQGADLQRQSYYYVILIIILLK